jgi:4-hydroxybenzoyl-CoA thioesterase
MLTNRREIYIELGDFDPGGFVFFPRYFEYFDSCMNRLFECAGLHKPEMTNTYGIAGIPMVDARTQFFLSSAYSVRKTLDPAGSMNAGGRIGRQEKIWLER